MATPSSGKKGKKKKGQKKTVSLNEFLGDTPTYSPTPASKGDWADDADDLGPVDLAEEYGGPKKISVDISKLPSAPRASRGLDIDLTKLPSKPPYTAFLGNLPFDVSEEEILLLFRGLKVENIRFPQEQGRTKGFGYAEFPDIDQLKSALALNSEKVRNRPIRIDIADQAGKDNMSRDDRMGRGGPGGADDRTEGDWRRGGDDVPPINNRYDDRRGGGGGGFDRHGGPMDNVDGQSRRPAGPADTDDCWRKDDPPANPSTNGWSDRGGRGDDTWGRRDGPRDFRNDRGPRDFRDDRGSRDFRDDRGPRDFRDNRGPRDFRDDRGPRDFRDDRGPRDFRDDRGPRDFRDDRGPRDFRDDRGPRDFRDDRGPRDFNRGDRGPRDFRDDRGPRSYRDDRGQQDYRDDRTGRDGGWRSDVKDTPNEGRAPDIVPDEPKERPKLSLKPRSVDSSVGGKTPTSSIFGGARPVDTAQKERQIEEKLAKVGVSSSSPEKSKEGEQRSYQSPSKDRGNRDEEARVDDEGPENWRDENIRHDNPRVMRPDLIIEAEKGHNRDRILSDGSDKGGRDARRGMRGGSSRGGRGRGRDKSNEGRKNKDVVPPKYEEPAQPVFGQSSKFALLADEEDENENESEGEGEQPVEATS